MTYTLKALVFFLCLSIFSLIVSPTFAMGPAPKPSPKEASASGDINDLFSSIVDPGALEVGDSLISPSSGLYFLKTLRERIESFLSPNDTIKAQRELEFSVRRLREVKTLIDEKREDLISPTLDRYKQHLALVQQISANNTDTRTELGSSAARHMYVLQTLYYQMSDQGAKQATRDSIRAVLDYEWAVLKDNLSQQEENAFVTNIKLREVAACQFLDKESKQTEVSESERNTIKQYLDTCKVAVNPKQK